MRQEVLAPVPGDTTAQQPLSRKLPAAPLTDALHAKLAAAKKKQNKPNYCEWCNRHMTGGGCRPVYREE